MKLEEAIKQSNFESELHKLTLNIMYTSQWMEDPVKKLLSRFKLTPPQFNILRILRGSHPDPKSPNDIKKVMIHKKSDLTRMLDRLESKDLIYRRICPHNRRKMDITISEKGFKTLEEINPLMREITHERLKDKLSEAEATKVNLLLDKLRS